MTTSLPGIDSMSCSSRGRIPGRHHSANLSFDGIAGSLSGRRRIRAGPCHTQWTFAGGTTSRRLWSLATAHGYDVEVRWSEEDARLLDALFFKTPTAWPVHLTKPQGPFANDPSWTSPTLEVLDELRQTARARLPEIMVPAVFVPMRSFPSNAHGKVDRAALPSIGLRRHANVIPPATPTQIAVARIFERLFNLEPAGLNHDFFELGGHSLTAVRLFKEIETAVGKRLPPSTILKLHTVRELADVIESAPEQDGSVIVPMRVAGTRPVLFCIHAYGGDLIAYADLVRRLGPDQPVYGVKALRQDDGALLVHKSLDEMVDCYVRAIQEVQAHGPYHMMGLCFGGRIAYAVATRLAQMGESVRTLALLETPAPGHPRFHPPLRRLVSHLHNLKALSLVDRLVYLKKRTAAVRELTNRSLVDWAGHSLHRLGVGVPQFLRSQEMAGLPPGEDERLDPYAGRVQLIRAQTPYVGVVDDEAMGWRSLVQGELSITRIPGSPTNSSLAPILILLRRACMNF